MAVSMIPRTLLNRVASGSVEVVEGDRHRRPAAGGCRLHADAIGPERKSIDAALVVHDTAGPYQAEVGARSWSAAGPIPHPEFGVATEA
jgi:hypothetical protein